ncbi:hypothetical protein XA68_14220 [Ophiocordyceps unilateralis]|uniref:DUF7735 domain-containing protein n=1 Tax=Ophiocordyceps unilateralis TaxID=268505 RepID=A0A2A9PB10_OPHUN|nr:hypothetical protein XA68_14220 [Ophiocordyceps unilateralis]
MMRPGALSIILLLKASITTASLFDLILPTETPKVTSDDDSCTSATLERFFDPPRPTPSLQRALWLYEADLYEGCTAEGTNVVGMTTCAFPTQSQLCAFTTAAPAALLPEFTSYASSASSWWSAHQSEAVELARRCPASWFNAMMAMASWGPLNFTIGFAGCYEGMRPAAAEATTTVTTGGRPAAGTRGATASGGGDDDARPTATANSNGVVGRAEGSDVWLAVGSGVVVAAVNSVIQR